MHKNDYGNSSFKNQKYLALCQFTKYCNFLKANPFYSLNQATVFSHIVFEETIPF